ncbi:MAG: cell division protein FtsQ/DivIB [bacterium]
MKKVKEIFSALFYVFIFYFLTFMFVAFFTLSAESLQNWKQSSKVQISYDRIEVTGNKMLSKKEVVVIAGLEHGKSWFDLDERKTEGYLLANGWVKSVLVKKTFPDSVKIVIEEHVPSIVVNIRRPSTSPQEKKDVYTLWFADYRGVVFKRVFPGETTPSLPFFYISSDILTEKERAKKIVTAVEIAKTWNKTKELCNIKSIEFNFPSGFSADCEAQNSMTTHLTFGDKFQNEEIEKVYEKFQAISNSLAEDGKWAGKYIFWKKKDEIETVVGEVFNIRGS